MSAGRKHAASPKTLPQACSAHAESKRAIYDSSGRSAVYAYEKQGRSPSSPYKAGFRTPRARSGWSNLRYQQQQYNTHGVPHCLCASGMGGKLIKIPIAEDLEVIVFC